MKNLLFGMLLLTPSVTIAQELTIRGRVIHEVVTPRATTGGGRQGSASQGIFLTSNGILIQTTSVSPQGGTFQFKNLLPGRYFVSLEPGIAGIPPVEVVLVDKDTAELQIKIPAVTLGGTLLVQGGGITPPIRLLLNSTVQGVGAQIFSISETAFSIPKIPIGTYGIAVPGLPEGYSVKSITAGTADLLSEKLSLTATASPRIAITLAVSSPPPWVPVHGVLTGRDAAERPPPRSEPTARLIFRWSSQGHTLCDSHRRSTHRCKRSPLAKRILQMWKSR